MNAGFFTRPGLTRAWLREAGLAAVALLLGFGIMPLIIYFAGASLLGRYEGASVSRLYEAVYAGLGAGSRAAWAVVMGPYALYVLGVGLRRGWRAGTRPA